MSKIDHYVCAIDFARKYMLEQDANENAVRNLKVSPSGNKFIYSEVLLDVETLAADMNQERGVLDPEKDDGLALANEHRGFVVGIVIYMAANGFQMTTGEWASVECS